MRIARLRKNYLLLFLLTIVVGLTSRKVSLPHQTGDLLYASMVYWMFRFVYVKQQKYQALLYAILFCFVIEFMQLLQFPWLVAMRHHPFLKLVLGQSFLWTDLVAYIIGAFLAFTIDSKRIETKKQVNS